MIDFLFSRGLGTVEYFYKQIESSSYLDKVKRVFHFTHIGCDCSFRDYATEMFVKKVNILSSDHPISIRLIALKEIISMAGHFYLSDDEKGLILFHANRIPREDLNELNLELEKEGIKPSQTFIEMLSKQLIDPIESNEKILTEILHKRLLKISLNYRLIQLNVSNLERNPSQLIEILDSLKVTFNDADRLFVSYRVTQFYQNYMKTKYRLPIIEERILSIIEV